MVESALVLILSPVQSAAWSDEAHTSIAAVINTLAQHVPNDPANADRIAIAAWEAAGNTIAAFVAAPAPVPQIISDRQFYQGLAIEGLISQDEALAAVKTGTLPAAIEALVDALPGAQQFPARMLLSGATQFDRAHPLTATLSTLHSPPFTAAQLDDFWRDWFAL